MRPRVLTLALTVAVVPALAAGGALAQAPPAPAPPAPAVTTTPAPPAGVQAGPARGRIATGVTIAGVNVAGLTGVQAREAVLAQHVAPRRAALVAVFRGRRVPISPVRAGYAADVRYAVRAALNFGRGRPVVPAVDVPLRQTVNLSRTRGILAHHARRLDLAPRDAAVAFSGTRPVVRRPRLGVRIDVGRGARMLRDVIVARDRAVVALPSRRVRPAVTRVPPAVLIERNRFRLTLFRNGARESFGVAVGQSVYPTPTGSFSIVTKQVDPTWFPPSSPWAAGLGPVPPGVSNPLGTRWMGTSAPGIGIHGTPQAGSIGSAASHGCIRMRIPDAEYLYDRIQIGTLVKIV